MAGKSLVTLYITEGKYGNQLEKIRKFRVVLSSGSHETGSTAKKVTASDSAKPGPHKHIYFLSQASRVRVEMGTKAEKVCLCVRAPSMYEALMLLNFCGDRGRGLVAGMKLLRVSNCRKLLESKVLGICLK